MRNVLVIQLGDIGDVVLAAPAFRAVGETFPGARVTALVRKGCASLLSAEPYLHEVLESARDRGRLSEIGRDNLSLVRRLRRARYDVVIDLRTGDRGAILSFLTGAPERIGRYEAGKPFWRRRCFTRMIVDPPPGPTQVHPGADQSLRVMRAIGIDTADSIPRLHVGEKDRERAIAILAGTGIGPGARFATVNPFSRWKYKEWALEKWGGVVDRLWERHGLSSVLIGSPGEAAEAGRILRGREGYARSATGKTTLGELAALLSRSVLHLGVDSAAPHIAAAVGTPTVTIFGPGNWKSWTVEDAAHRIASAFLPCVPCNDKGCNDTERSYCLEILSVDAVMERADGAIRLTAPSCEGGRTARSGTAPSPGPS